MKFKTFLLQEDSEITFEEAIRSIAKKCKPFLNESEDHPLFRGIALSKVTRDGYTTFENKILFTQQPEDRQPRDSTLNFNILFDAMIDCVFGIKNIRTHSVFASGNSAIAGGYGTEHIIFPAGEFKYIWSPKINDSVSDTSDMLQKIARFGSQHGFHLSAIAMRTMWNKIPSSSEPYYASEWVEGGKTIVNHTQSAYQYSTDGLGEDTEESIHQMIKDGMFMYGSKFYKSTNLPHAISSGHEILIHESKGYYSLPIKIVLNEYNKARGLKGSAEWDDMYKFILEEIAKVG